MLEHRVYELPDSDHAGLAAQAPEAVMELLRTGDGMLSYPVLAALDYGSRRWAAGRALPYADEIARIASQVRRPGAWFANLNYEWGCSAGVFDGSGGVPVLARVLDWPFPRLGEMAAIVNCQSPAGPWTNITWPGCVGVLQANARGRFAASINQAPRVSFGLGRYIGLAAGWLYSKARWIKATGVPPVLLLRQVMTEAPDYAAALKRLTETEVAKPVIYALSGTQPGEYAIIQKSYAGTAVRQALAVSNCWLDPGMPGDLGPHDPPARRKAMEAYLAEGENFRWLKPPVLNADSRLAVELCPATGLVRVQGWNGTEPVTEVFTQSGAA